MHIKMIEVSLSKEERRIVDEYGNSASTWARIGLTAELAEGDEAAACIVRLREEIQPQIDDWLLQQGENYIPPAPEPIDEVFEEIPVEATATSDTSDDDIPL